jgi:hypothetical protein
MFGRRIEWSPAVVAQEGNAPAFDDAPQALRAWFIVLSQPEKRHLPDDGAHSAL